MELVNTFHVDANQVTTWNLLTDLERLAPCLPGATLEGRSTEDADDAYRGSVKVKVGPISAVYRGKARFLETDGPRRAVLRAEGQETRGQGGATADVEAVLSPAPGGGTDVRLVTDMQVSGRMAAFGRGLFEEVSDKLLAEFSTNIASLVHGAGGGDDVTPAQGATAGDPGLEAPPIDAGSLLAGPILRRGAPAIGVLVAVLLLLRRGRLRRRRGPGRGRS